MPCSTSSASSHALLRVTLLGINVAFLALLLWSAPLAWRHIRRGPSLDALLVVTLVFTSLYVAALALDYRFYPLPLAVLMILALRNYSEIRFRKSLAALWVVSVALSVAPTLQATREPRVDADAVLERPSPQPAVRREPRSSSMPRPASPPPGTSPTSTGMEAPWRSCSTRRTPARLQQLSLRCGWSSAVGGLRVLHRTPGGVGSRSAQ